MFNPIRPITTIISYIPLVLKGVTVYSYGVYSDSWKIQGGLWSLTANGDQTFNFIKALSSTNYTIIGTLNGNDSTSNLGVTGRYTSYAKLNPAAGGTYDCIIIGK